jgi:hypothetical protein
MKDILCIIPYYDFVGDNEHLLQNHSVGIHKLQQQGVDTVSIEAVYNNTPRLPSNETVQFHVSDILWYKEAIINLALKYFRKQYKYLAWIDSGFLLDKDWIEKSLAQLEQYPIVQCFSHGVWLDTKGQHTRTTQGLRYAITTDDISGASPGGAWIARSEVCCDNFLYDKNLVGGGDAAWALPMCGLEYPSQLCSPAHWQDYQSWLKQSPTMNLECSCIDGCFYHLWHGHTKNRRHKQRHEILMSHRYDPVAHMCYNDDGLLQYQHGIHKALIEDVNSFFVYRASPHDMSQRREIPITPSQFVVDNKTKTLTSHCIGGRIVTQ